MLPPDNKLERFFESHKGHETIGILVIFNAIIWGVEAMAVFKDASSVALFQLIDKIILGFFVLELATRIYASGLRFFKKGWNLFDTFVILIALIPSGGPLSVLRALRVLRVMRLISLSPKMKIVVSATCNAIPGILSVATILILSFYVSAIIAFNLFSMDNEYFSTLGRTMFTLSQLMLIDNWGNIIQSLSNTHPYCYLYFIPFMLFMTFTVLNLFFGLIVNSMQNAAEAENKTLNAGLDPLITIQSDIKELKTHINELKSLMKEK
jgi:voltage-gated sodium channel